MLTRFLLLTVVVALAVAAQALADKVLDTSIGAFTPGGFGQTGRADGFYATGFEPGEGFSPGWVHGQAGWATFVTSTTEAHIDTANPFSGVQNLRISNDPTLDPGSDVGGFSPLLSMDPLALSITSVDVFISNTLGADYDVIPQAPGQGYLTARVKFFYTGDIYILDDVPGTGLTFVDTGTDWVVGEYRNLSIEVDPLGDTIDYYYGGSLIYTSQGGVFAGTTVEQVVLLSDNWQLNDQEAGDFDNLSIVPEPGALGWLSVVCLLVIRGRRKS
jgi:hypothetical protein